MLDILYLLDSFQIYANVTIQYIKNIIMKNTSHIFNINLVYY
jgi:hypothetical protein